MSDKTEHAEVISVSPPPVTTSCPSLPSELEGTVAVDAASSCPVATLPVSSWRCVCTFSLALFSRTELVRAYSPASYALPKRPRSGPCGIAVSNFRSLLNNVVVGCADLQFDLFQSRFPSSSKVLSSNFSVDKMDFWREERKVTPSA